MLPQKRKRRTLQVNQAISICSKGTMSSTNNQKNSNSTNSRHRASTTINMNSIMDGEEDEIDEELVPEARLLHTRDYYNRPSFIDNISDHPGHKMGIQGLLSSPNRRPSVKANDSKREKQLATNAARSIRSFDNQPYRYGGSKTWAQMRAFLMKLCYYIVTYIGDLPRDIRDDEGVCPGNDSSSVQDHHRSSIENLWCMAVLRVAYGSGFGMNKMIPLSAQLCIDPEEFKDEIYFCFVVPAVCQLVRDLTHAKCLAETTVSQLLNKTNPSSFACTISSRLKKGIFSVGYLEKAMDPECDEVQNVEEHPASTKFTKGVNLVVLQYLALFKHNMKSTAKKHAPRRMHLLTAGQFETIGQPVGPAEDPIQTLFRKPM